MSTLTKNKLTSLTPNSENLFEKFNSRKSSEIIIGFVGPIGCGISQVIDDFSQVLLEKGYKEIVKIKLSEFLSKSIDDGTIETEGLISGCARFKRYRSLQEAGKSIRISTNNMAILAEYAASEIALDRARRNEHIIKVNNLSPSIPGKVAYLIDQLKRPEEVALLRAIYRNLFYTVGITRTSDKRDRSLQDEMMDPTEVSNLILIDKNESEKYGQKVDKTLHLADYFFRNEPDEAPTRKANIERFLALIHGDKSITPTYSEQGMYAAYFAGLRSACLSRQVGAAIATTTGEIISTGCNDVPKAGGGLYTEGVKPDSRCMHRDNAFCYNDKHKNKIKDQIGLLLEETIKNVGGNLSKMQREKFLDEMYQNTGLGSLIEFSRAVHAEMDAIITLARIGGAGLKNATLYTTTFPCHSCARHIVAARITKVVYIEPYEKSLAKDLHSDAIVFDAIDDGESKHVKFIHFNGVAPARFHLLFSVNGRKDSSGKFIKMMPENYEKVLPEYLDGYQHFEIKAVDNFHSEITAIKNSLTSSKNIIKIS